MRSCNCNPALLAILLAILVASCIGPSGSTVEEQRASALAMRDEALDAFCADDPALRQHLAQAPGYAVFSSFSIHPGLVSFARGYGVLTNNRTGHITHQDWTRLTFGPGIAIKGLYALAIMHDPVVVERFEAGPWTFIGQLEASLVFGDFGGALEAGWIFSRKVDVRYITHTGVALEIELIGLGKVSIDDTLNQAKPR
jgi:hypothetical protein